MSNKESNDFNIQDDESCNHDNVCPCCVARESLIDEFIDNLMKVVQTSGKLSIEKLLSITDDFYSDAYDQGSKDTYSEIVGYAAHQIQSLEEGEDI